MIEKKIILFSGGIDSTLLTLKALDNGDTVMLLHFEYEHPAQYAELTAIYKLYKLFQNKYDDRVSLFCLKIPINASDMFIGEKQQGSRIVVNRNSIFLNIAINLAAANKIDKIEYGAVLDDNSDYLDCKPLFLEKINAIAKDWNVVITAPFIYTSKKDLFNELCNNIVFKEILGNCSSCYEPMKIETGEYIACGCCSSCLSNRIDRS